MHITHKHPAHANMDIVFRVCMVRPDLSAAFIVTHKYYWQQCRGKACWALPEHTLENNYVKPPGDAPPGRKRPRTRQSHAEEIDLQNQAEPSTAAASTAMIQPPTAPTTAITNTISDPSVRSFIESQAAQGRGVIFSHNHTNTSLEIKPRV